MPLAFIIGGTGQIGLAVARRLVGEGWEVVLASRHAPPVAGAWRHVRLDRTADGALGAALGEGADLVLDCLSMDEGDAVRLLSVQNRVGHIAAVSSASVYADGAGRTLDEARENGFPRFPVPIPEDHPTAPPGPETYSTRKVAMERALLDHAVVPVTVLRPCAIHGPHSRHAREWWFVKRLLDGCTRIPLAYGGRSRFQTTSTEAIAAAVVHALGDRRAQVLNVADADAPTVREIGETIMDVMGRRAELIGLEDEPYPSSVGATPWSTERPLVCATSVPDVRTYAETVPAAVEWLVETVDRGAWQAALPQLAAYPRDHFAYGAEDELLGRKGIF